MPNPSYFELVMVGQLSPYRSARSLQASSKRYRRRSLLRAPGRHVLRVEPAVLVIGLLLALSGALFQPAFQRCLAFARGSSSQEAFNADVLVEIGPVNSLAAADQPPVISLF